MYSSCSGSKVHFNVSMKRFFNTWTFIAKWHCPHERSLIDLKTGISMVETNFYFPPYTISALLIGQTLISNPLTIKTPLSQDPRADFLFLFCSFTLIVTYLLWLPVSLPASVPKPATTWHLLGSYPRLPWAHRNQTPERDNTIVPACDPNFQTELN